ncbi:MAG TPA: flagellar hook protein FlgE [Bryobacterales bacterium]|jgi:flagellar hook protein FlgE|nr:flagellar hook protein FlgE [Bryobacterales bacterium]
MPSSFSTALSGLRGSSDAVNVIANNLANMNTIAYKASVAEFSDLIYQQVGQNNAGVPFQIGLGTAPISVIRQFDQGTIQNTSGLLDAAIQGAGFFVVRRGDATLYTRAGNFQLNKLGQLVDSSSDAVQGWVQDASGTVNTNLPVGDIVIPVGQTLAPKATGLVRLGANLSATAATGDTFSAPLQVFDSLGSPHILTFTFTKAASGWNLDVTIPGADVGSANTTESILTNAPVNITFDQNGILVNPGTPPPSPPPYNLTIDSSAFNLADGAAPLNITWSLLDPQGNPTITQFAQASAVATTSQDGLASAQLTTVSIADGGKVVGTFSDGQTKVLAQIALATFISPLTLAAVGGNNYIVSSASGTPAIGTADTGGRGSVVGASLEFSNVDIAREFTALMTAQRSFQANSRVITTADDLNQEAINLKR